MAETPFQTGWIPSNIGRLPTPKASNDLDTFALWMLAGNEVLRAKEGLPHESLRRLSQAAELAAEADPNNGFWHQMRALLNHTMGNETEAERAWQRASLATFWNDFQSKRLLRIKAQFAAETGASMGWQLRAVFELRSNANIKAITALARDLLANRSMGKKEDLLVRAATVGNAQIIRNGSRSIAIGQAASDLMDMAAYPPGVAIQPSIRLLLLARQQLTNKLSGVGEAEASRRVLDAFRLNDNWIGLISGARAPEHLENLSVVTLLSATLPSICMLIAAFGAVTWWFGSMVLKSARLQKIFQPPIAPVLGIVLAITVYYLTQLPLASITAVLCFAFLVFTPAQERSRPPSDLGMLFGLIVAIIGVAVFLNLTAFLIGVSTPGAHVLPTLGIPKEYTGGSTLFLGLTGIMLGLLLLTAPTWGSSEKIATPKVVGMGLKTLGSGLCAVCLGLAVILGPLAVYADGQASEVLQKLVENEPNYYLVQ